MRHILLLLVICSTIHSLCAQTFTRGVDRYSKKKVSYLTLTDGSKVEGNIKDVDRKKGQIKSIKLKLEDGSKVEYTPDQISTAFLPASGWDNFSKNYDDAFNATTWDKESPEGALIKDGYAYFQSEEVIIKKKKRILLMQVVNPHFNKLITVYHDALAAQTASVGIGGIQVAGGLEKSYYIKLSPDEPVVRMKKKDYKKEFKNLYGDCDQIKPEEAKRMYWDDFPEHVYNFTTKCN